MQSLAVVRADDKTKEDRRGGSDAVHRVSRESKPVKRHRESERLDQTLERVISIFFSSVSEWLVMRTDDSKEEELFDLKSGESLKFREEKR